MSDLRELLRRIGNERSFTEKSGTPDGKSTLLLLTCIDLRYPSLILNLMEAEGFHKRYDQVALAGAGLAAVIDFPPHPKPHWQQTFIEHVSISSILHSISTVLVMDHRDCGAFRAFGLLKQEPPPSEPDQLREFLIREKETHRQTFCKTAAFIKQHFPQLEVEGILLPKEVEEHKLSEGDPCKLPPVPYEDLLCD
jgi:carbonic anhydrase